MSVAGVELCAHHGFKKTEVFLFENLFLLKKNVGIWWKVLNYC